MGTADIEAITAAVTTARVTMDAVITVLVTMDAGTTAVATIDLATTGIADGATRAHE